MLSNAALKEVTFDDRLISQSMDQKTGIIIYEDNHKLRASLCMLTEGFEDSEVVGNFPNCNHVIH